MSNEFTIQRAERTQTKLRIALTGASFAGKTTGALLLAKGLIDGMVAAGQLQASQNPRIGLIDTERKRASLYSHLVPFDKIDLAPPYSIERYLGAMRALEDAGYEAIIIDSTSHAWSGAGGALSMIKSDNSFAEWRKINPVLDEFIDAIMRSRAHMIVTMRSKTEWVIEKQMNKAGREVNTPRRIGMKPVQRDGIEYEFTTVLDLQIQPDKTRMLQVHKDNTGVFEVVPLRQADDWVAAGVACIEWMASGAPVNETPREPDPVDKARAVHDAFIRIAEECRNLPDLARQFQSTGKQLRDIAEALTGQDRDAVNAMFADVVVVKDKRKLELSAKPEAPPVDAITADDYDMIDSLLTAAGMDPADFCMYFELPRIAMLPLAKYEEAVTWVIETAGAEGIELKRPTRAGQDAGEPKAVQKAKAIVERIGNAKDDLLRQPPPEEPTHDPL